MRQVDHDAGKESSLGNAQDEARPVELVGRVNQSGERANQRPTKS